MNAHLRLPIALLASLLAHIGLLLWLSAQVHVSPLLNQAHLQVFLQNHAASQGPRQSYATTTNKNTTQYPSATHADISLQSPSLSSTEITDQSIIDNRQSTVQFRWHPVSPALQLQNIDTIYQAQSADQRRSRVSAILTGLSNLSAQLSPVLTGKIVCTQQSPEQIVCTPAPDPEIQALLEQFFNLAFEARQLGIAENPVHMDFGSELGISIDLLP